MRFVRIAGVVGLAGLTLPTALPAQQEYEVVLGTVQRLFDAMAQRDTTTFLKLTLPEAGTVAVLVEGDSSFVRRGTHREFLQVLAGTGPRLLERMWQPEVRISGPIATVWTPYDFHMDGTFTHCGVDAFQLVHTNEGWKVGAIMYTIVRPQARCHPSPLGPPTN